MSAQYTTTFTMGRPLSENGLRLRREFLKFVKRKPGISNVELAKKLEVTSLRTSVLGRVLHKQGLIEVTYDGRSVHYTATDE